MTTDQVRVLWLLFCQMESCRTKLVFLELAEFNQIRRALAVTEITSDIFTLSHWKCKLTQSNYDQNPVLKLWGQACFTIVCI